MGHKLQMYENLRDMLEREVKDIEKKGDLDVQTLDHLFKLMTSIKNTDKCIAYEKGEEEEKQGGMSMRSMANNAYGNNMSYEGRSNNTSNMIPFPYSMDTSMARNAYEGRSNESYERGRSNESYERGRSNDGMSNEGTSNARRGRDGDSDGRYNESRDNFRDSQDRGRSYENTYGYSRDASKKKMVQKLETLMDDTMSEHERQAIMDCINKIK